ncbi:18467_t:CDS:2, partial [Dentiscutata erythropus]
PPQQHNAIDNLAAQIGLLIQQMQVAPAPQVNYNAPNWKLNLVAYPDFTGGDQDPVSWLDEVEKAFAANLVSNDCQLPVIVPHLKGPAATLWATMQQPSNPINSGTIWSNPILAFDHISYSNFAPPHLKESGLLNWPLESSKRNLLFDSLEVFEFQINKETSPSNEHRFHATLIDLPQDWYPRVLDNYINAPSGLTPPSTPTISSSGPNGAPPIIFLESDSDESNNSNFDWYKTRWKNRKAKTLTVTCQYDLAGNAYLTEEGAKKDLQSHLVTEPVEKEEVEEIRDVFDYYYGEDLKKRNTYQIGDLSTVQDS